MSLVLSRKIDEEIVIADNIIVTVLGITGNRVELAVAAPRSTPVHRREIHDQLAQEQRSFVQPGRGRKFLRQ
jgi:carbon storage regulator